MGIKLTVINSHRPKGLMYGGAWCRVRAKLGLIDVKGHPQKLWVTDELDGHPAKARPSSSLCQEVSSSPTVLDPESKGVSLAPIRTLHALYPRQIASTPFLPRFPYLGQICPGRVKCPGVLGGVRPIHRAGDIFSCAVGGKHDERPTEWRTPETRGSAAKRASPNRGSAATVLYAPREGGSEDSRYTPVNGWWSV